MAVETIASGWVAVLATYALHSTVILGAGLLAARLLRSARPRLAERCLKIALVAPLFSTGAQLALAVEPLAGRVDLVSVAPSIESIESPATIEVPAVASIEAYEPRPWRVASASPPWSASPSSPRSIPSSDPSSPAPILIQARSEPARPAWWSAPWPVWALALWSVGLAVAAGARARDGWALWRTLRGRRRLADPRFADQVERLRLRAGLKRAVDVWIAPQARVPMSLGFTRPRIVLPPRVIAELGPAAVEAVLAHELAHLVRRDPTWTAIANALETLAFFQPLHTLVRKRLDEIAELECDAWARQHAACSIELARALSQIATWLLEERRAPSRLVPSMARTRSQLAVRIERLLAPARVLRARESRLWSCLPWLAALVLSLATPVFGVRSLERRDDHEARERSEPEVARREQALAPAPSAVQPSAKQRADDPATFANAPDAIGSPSDAVEASPDESPRFGASSIDSRDALEQACAVLDGEIDALEAELAELEAAIGSEQEAARFVEAIDSMRERISQVIDRRARLRELIDVLVARAHAQSNASSSSEAPPDTLNTEIVR